MKNCSSIANRRGLITSRFIGIVFWILVVMPVSKAQTISTIAGTGIFGYSGDGGAATSAQLYFPGDIAVDKSGNVYIADIGNSRIRKVSTSGVITTTAGNGVDGFSGDGGPSASSQLFFSNRAGLAIDDFDNIYIADRYNKRIRKINSLGIITTIAGDTGTVGGIAGAYIGNGGPATMAELGIPRSVAVDHNGIVYISGSSSYILKIGTNGIIDTVAGTFFLGGEGITVDAANNLYACNGTIVSKITASGIITTIAGNGTNGYSGDGGPATLAEINASGLTVDKKGNLYIADGNRIRKVDPSGTITTVAGDGILGYNGDGQLATLAELASPTGLTIDDNGDLLIADFNNNRVRKVITSTGINTLTTSVNGIQIYPMPNKGSFVLKGQYQVGIQYADIKVTNILGQVIYSDIVHLSNGVLNEVVNLNVIQGMYQMNVVVGNEVNTIGFVVTQ